MSADPQTPNQPIRRLSNPPALKRSATMGNAYYEPGDFIKPDPAMTRSETRTYILKELKSCLTERLTIDDDEYSIGDGHLQYRSNPKERLFHVGQFLEELNSKEKPGEKAFTILENYLNRATIDYDTNPVKLVQLALGFIHTDLLPCGRTIFSFWNHSPFHILRNAPPLTDEDHDEIAEKETTPSAFSIADNMITIRIPYNILAVYMACTTVWIAMLVAQLVPIRTTYACL